MNTQSSTEEMNSRPLTGVERVAVMLLALDKPRAANLLKHFDAEDLRKITKSAAGLRPVTSDDLSIMVDEFVDRFSDGLKFLGTAEEVEDLMAEVMTEDQLVGLMGGQSDVSVWELVDGMAPKKLAELLQLEHPQVAAFILSQTKPEQVVDVVPKLPEAFQHAVFRRMMNVGAITDEMSDVIESALLERLTNATADAPEAYLQSHIAEVLGKLGKSKAEEVLAEMALKRPADVKAIKSLMFSFEDLLLLSKDALATVFDRAPVEQVIAALPGVEPDLAGMILGSLSGRARRMVEAELQSGQQPPERTRQEARQAIADGVLELIKKGEIEPPTVDGDEADVAA